jgi:anti-sigma B factor antagonist
VRDTSTNQSLTITVDRPAVGTTVLRVSGEIDMLTCPDLRHAITEQLGDGQRRLVIDLSEVLFLGTSGLAALVEARAEAISRDLGLWLVCSGRQVRRPLEIAGLVELFHIAESVPRALEQISLERGSSI